VIESSTEFYVRDASRNKVVAAIDYAYTFFDRVATVEVPASGPDTVMPPETNDTQIVLVGPSRGGWIDVRAPIEGSNAPTDAFAGKLGCWIVAVTWDHRQSCFYVDIFSEGKHVAHFSDDPEDAAEAPDRGDRDALLEAILPAGRRFSELAQIFPGAPTVDADVPAKLEQVRALFGFGSPTIGACDEEDWTGYLALVYRPNRTKIEAWERKRARSGDRRLTLLALLFPVFITFLAALLAVVLRSCRR
jgi:hypothetical protein